MLGTNCRAARIMAVLTKNVGQLTNDFFLNLLTMETEWKAAADGAAMRAATARPTSRSGAPAAVDLIFGAHSQLRAFAEVICLHDSSARKFVKDFVAAWVKVMNADRFDLVAAS